MTISLTEVINAAIGKNATGCDLYQQGKRLESRTAFRSAASVLHHLLGNVLPYREGTHSEKTAFSPCDVVTVTSSPMMEESTWNGNAETCDEGSTLSSAESNELTPSSVLFVNDVLKIPKCPTEEPQHSLHLVINRTVAAVILNLAQTYLGGDGPDMIHAMTLFESAFTLVMKELPLTCFISEKVALVALNNAAQLRWEYGDFELTRQYLDTLIHLIHTLPLTFDVSRQEFRSHFLFNALLSSKPLMIAARAA